MGCLCIGVATPWDDCPYGKSNANTFVRAHAYRVFPDLVCRKTLYTLASLKYCYIAAQFSISYLTSCVPTQIDYYEEDGMHYEDTSCEVVKYICQQVNENTLYTENEDIEEEHEAMERNIKLDVHLGRVNLKFEILGNR